MSEPHLYFAQCPVCRKAAVVDPDAPPVQILRSSPPGPPLPWLYLNQQTSRPSMRGAPTSNSNEIRSTYQG